MERRFLENRTPGRVVLPNGSRVGVLLLSSENEVLLAFGSYPTIFGESGRFRVAPDEGQLDLYDLKSDA